MDREFQRHRHASNEFEELRSGHSLSGQAEIKKRGWLVCEDEKERRWGDRAIVDKGCRHGRKVVPLASAL